MLTIPPPPVQGLGSAGGFKMMLEDRAGLGSEALVKAAQALVAAANKDPSFAGVFTLFSTGSPSVYADIDRVKAEKVGPDADRRLLHAAGLSRLAVRQRLQLSRPHLPGHRAGRRGVPAHDRRTSRASRRATRPARWCRSARWRSCKDKTIPYRVPRYNLFPAAEVQGVAAPGVATGTALHRMEELAHQVLPQGIALRMDRSRLPAAAARHADLAGVRRRRAVRLPGAGRAVRELEAAAGHRADRADVPARFRHRPARARHADRHPGADRLRRAGRPGGQERHPDRGVRPAEGGGRRRPPAKPRCTPRARGCARS